MSNSTITGLDQTQNVDRANIPVDLTSRSYWVFWRYVERDDNTTKEPFDPHTGFRASTTDTETWGTLEQAMAANERHKGEGVGFVFSEDDTLAGVDLDDCIDTNTGEIHADARAIIDRLNSYTEFSPSGTGLKVFVHGIKPTNERCRTKNTPWGGDIEIYDRARFFTVTGDHLPGTPDQVYSRKSAFEGIYNRFFDTCTSPATPTVQPGPPESVNADQIIKKALAARNGDKFKRLMYDEFDPKRVSEDDMALASMVVFYTGGDIGLAEDVLRRSVRTRSKWDDRRGNTTWIRQRIERAVSRRDPDDFYVWPSSSKFPDSNSLNRTGIRELYSPIPVVDLDHGYQADDEESSPIQTFGRLGRPEPVPWIVENRVPAGHASMIYGMGGDGKSFLALDMAMHVAAGCDYWLGHRVNPTRVLYLDFELDNSIQGKRAFDLAAGMGLDQPPDDLLYMSALDTDVPSAFQRALDACVDHDIGLIVVDSVGPAMQGDAEASTDVLAFLDAYIKPFRSAGVAAFMVDHQAKIIKGEHSKNKLPFGSVYKFNMCRSVMQFEGSRDEAGLNVQIRHTKCNFGPVQEDFAARLTFAKDVIEVQRAGLDAFDQPDPPTVSERIMDALKSGPLYPREIAEAADMDNLKTVQNLIPTLVNVGKLEYTGETEGRARQVRLAPAYDPKTIYEDKHPKQARNGQS
jgi:hypothetical protein